jgi:hypothetical protein
MVRLILILILLIAGLTACRPAGETEITPTLPATHPPTLAPFDSATPMPGATNCAATRETVWPRLMDVLPSPVHPGEDVTVIASGGYVRDGCGGYNESARKFQLFFDDDPVDPLVCYVNHCEAKVRIPTDTPPGKYVIRAEGGSTLSLDVVRP